MKMTSVCNIYQSHSKAGLPTYICAVIRPSPQKLHDILTGSVAQLMVLKIQTQLHTEPEFGTASSSKLQFNVQFNVQLANYLDPLH